MEDQKQLTSLTPLNVINQEDVNGTINVSNVSVLNKLFTDLILAICSVTQISLSLSLSLSLLRAPCK